MMQEECNSLQRVVESLQKQKEKNDEILTEYVGIFWIPNFHETSLDQFPLKLLQIKKI